MRRDWKKSDFVMVDKKKINDETLEQLKDAIQTPNTIQKPQSFEIIRREEMDRSLDKSIAIVKFKKLRDDVELPLRATDGSAGYDVCANLENDITILPDEIVKIPTGFSTSFRKDYVALVYSRSGLALKNGLVVCQGTAVIDSDYRGEWFIPLHNQSSQPQLIRSGDRIAQLLIQPVCRMKAIEVDDLNETRRGRGGFGSTGI